MFRVLHPETVGINDIAHKAACLLKARLHNDVRWKAFASEAGRTKSRLQQTDCACLVPPGQRPKSRYMNLGPLIRWGAQTLSILDQPPDLRAFPLRHVSSAVLEQRLGWLREFRQDLRDWSELEDTIDTAVDFVRTNGLYRGAEQDLTQRLRTLSLGESAALLRRQLIEFVSEQSEQVPRGQRLPGSSEVLESCFGKFKAMERNQANGGFTGMLLGIAACVAERTQEVIHEALEKSKTHEVIDWIHKKLGSTVGAMRRIVYGSVKSRATPSLEPE